MNHNFKKIWNAMTTALIAFVVVVVFLIAGVKLLGVDTYIVLSGSMEPEIQTGSLIYVTKTNQTELETGDVITFHLSGDTVATHRIVEVIEEENEVFYKTKGDANEVEDGSLVPYDMVIGTPVFTIPYLGYLASYVQTSSGMYMMIAMGALLLLLVLIPELFAEEKKGDNE